MKPDQFRPLVDAVVNNRPQSIVWEAVFHIIETLTPSTPPRSSFPTTSKGTPIKTSSNRLADSEKSKTIEHKVFHKIKDCTFCNVGGFCNKFFNPKGWSKEQKAMLERVISAHNRSRWIGFPAIPNEQPV